MTTPRSWRYRVLDLRHCCGLTIRELAILSGIPLSTIDWIENCKTNSDYHGKTYHPQLPFILAIRRMEAIFKEELIGYLHKPHGLLRYREGTNRRVRLQPYGGYKRSPRPNTGPTVSFQGRSFKDIAAMEDLVAIRALKSVRPVVPAGFPCTEPPTPGRGTYGRIIEAASRGDFMPLDRIARVMGDDSAPQVGQPVQTGERV